MGIRYRFSVKLYFPSLKVQNFVSDAMAMVTQRKKTIILVTQMIIIAPSTSRLQTVLLNTAQNSILSQEIFWTKNTHLKDQSRFTEQEVLCANALHPHLHYDHGK